MELTVDTILPFLAFCIVALCIIILIITVHDAREHDFFTNLNSNISSLFKSLRELIESKKSKKNDTDKPIHNNDSNIVTRKPYLYDSEMDIQNNDISEMFSFKEMKTSPLAGDVDDKNNKNNKDKEDKGNGKK